MVTHVRMNMIGTNNFEHFKPGPILATHPTLEVIDHDAVNKPSHYMLNLSTGAQVEVYDIRDALLSICDEEGVPAGQVDDWSRAWEYLTRMWGKNGLEDAKKAKWYLTKLIERMENDA